MPFVSALFVYPVKSCGGIPLESALLESHGLAWDRHWMVIDRDGHFVSQRQYPAMALIHPVLSISTGMLELSAPGADTVLRLPLDAPRAAARIPVTIWKDAVTAFDEGDAPARWFSSVLGTDVRLVRFDRAETRLASQQWTQGVDSPTQFADGFPLLVTGEASLDEVNRRLLAKGAPAIPMNRFRPNIVLRGIEAFEEDFVGTLSIQPASTTSTQDAIELRFVKPCARCPITTVDHLAGRPDPQWPNEPLDTMAGWRANARVDGGLTFGQNAIVIEGAGRQLSVGSEVRWELDFPDDF
ncbi:MOSC domain-containing protein [Paraburkholderia flava]|uniref:MOSC domain-containing protein n=1 Tax=Paraburkholderia flava TaxID=2547393 RepID=UPI00105E612B|nr:MOSC N-terminal beta barrel domain-containing protein [Paraburkholderia flava]